MSRKPPPDLSLPAVFAVFNSVDTEGYLWLPFAQTRTDARDRGLVMAEGLRLIGSDHDLAAEVVVCADPEGGWRGRVVPALLHLG
jgi:hypothetical protein